MGEPERGRQKARERGWGGAEIKRERGGRGKGGGWGDGGGGAAVKHDMAAKMLIGIPERDEDS